MNQIDSGEPTRAATVSNMEIVRDDIVRDEGSREVAREVEFYNFDAISPRPISGMLKVRCRNPVRPKRSFLFSRAPLPSLAMASTPYQEIKDSLQELYVEDQRPWLVGFSGGKDSTMVAALVFDAVLSVTPEQRTKPITILCTDTHHGRISHKRAQRSQRTRSAEVFSLSASNGERAGVRCRFPPHSTFRTRHSPFPARPIQIDTPESFQGWTCTVVERDNRVARATRLRVSATCRHTSEGLLASGDERMEKLIEPVAV